MCRTEWYWRFSIKARSSHSFQECLDFPTEKTRENNMCSPVSISNSEEIKVTDWVPYMERSSMPWRQTPHQHQVCVKKNNCRSHFHGSAPRRRNKSIGWGHLKSKLYSKIREGANAHIMRKWIDTPEISMESDLMYTEMFGKLAARYTWQSMLLSEDEYRHRQHHGRCLGIRSSLRTLGQLCFEIEIKVCFLRKPYLNHLYLQHVTSTMHLQFVKAEITAAKIKRFETIGS